MGKIAFLFAGQGAQSPGMGQSLCKASPAAAEVFAAADAQRPGTSAMCFFGTAEELALTVNTQPCVYTVDLAAARALQEAGVQPEGVAGFSLGEVAALTFASVFLPDDGFRLVCRRAELMQAASEQNPGAMAAVLRMSDADVEALCQNFKQVWPVNYNSDGQLVVAAAQDELAAFCAAAKEAGGNARPLQVSGAFHSPFMAPAAAGFAAALAQYTLADPTLPVYANYTGKPYSEPYADLLVAQIAHAVRWKQSIQQMAADGFTSFIEVGPGKTLTGLVRRIAPEAALFNVQDAESLTATLATL